MNLGASKPKPPRANSRRKMPGWVAILLLLLLAPLLVFGRYGVGWAATELAAFIASWLVALLIKPPTWRTRPRRHSGWTFVYFVFLMTTLLFALVALFVGPWLSPWWCLVISLGAGVLSIAGIWPAQLRYYKLQRSLADGRVGTPEERITQRHIPQ